jgi:hypothetical protein
VKILRDRDSTRMVRITPYVAQAWLDNMHPRQRKPRMSWVNILAERISRCEWDCNAGAIVLDAEGRLVDGQHRLMACVRSKQPILAIVVQAEWSKYRDDTARRTTAERNGVTKMLSAVSRLCGRLTDQPDPDEALRAHGSWLLATPGWEPPHKKPWGAACIVLGWAAGGGGDMLRSLVSGVVLKKREGKLLSMAASGELATTGTMQYATAALVMEAVTGRAETVQTLRDEIKKRGAAAEGG